MSYSVQNPAGIRPRCVPTLSETAYHSKSMMWMKMHPALNRMLELTGGQQLVPVLVEDGADVQVGIGGRGCYVNPTR